MVLSFVSKIEIIVAPAKSFFISPTTSYSYISYYILNHLFDYIYKMVNMSGFPKILNIFLDTLSHFEIILSRSVLQFYQHHFLVQTYVQSIYCIIFLTV